MTLIINGEKVDDYLIEQEIHSTRMQQQEHPDSFEFEGPDDLVEYAKENVLCRILLQQEAVRRVADPTAEEVEVAFAQLKEQYGGAEQFYQAHNFDESHDDEIRGNLATHLKVQKLMEEICRDVPAPSDEEIAAYHAEHQDEYTYPEQIRASHIVKRPEQGGSEEVYEQMKALRRELLAGADFTQLAGENSDCQENGGDLGTFAPGQMVEEFDAILFSMEPGEISPVFLTQFGYHVAKVHERIAEHPCPLEEVRDDIAETILHDRKNDRIGEFVDEAKKTATIAEIPDEEPPQDADEPAEDEPAEDAPQEQAEADETPQGE